MRGGPLHRWQSYERDSAGHADAHYKARKGLFGRLLLSKRLKWHTSAIRPAMVSQEANVSAIIHNRSGALVWLRSQVKMSATVAPLPVTSGLAPSIEVAEVLDPLPKEPAIVEWKLVRPCGRYPKGMPCSRTSKVLLALHTMNLCV